MTGFGLLVMLDFMPVIKISRQLEVINMFCVSLENIHFFYGFTMTVENTLYRKMNFTLLNYFVISSLGFTVSLKDKPTFIYPTVQ